MDSIVTVLYEVDDHWSHLQVSYWGVDIPLVISPGDTGEAGWPSGNQENYSSED